MESMKLGKSNTLRSDKKLNLYERIIKQIKRSMNDMDFNSRILEGYYMEVLSPQTKNNLRNTLKVIILSWYGSTNINLMFHRSTPFSVVLGMIFTGCLMGIYTSTMFTNSSKTMTAITTAVMVLLYVSNLLNIHYVFGLIEIHFTPIVQIGILMFANLPIKLNNAIVLSTISFTMIILSASLSIQRKISLSLIKNNNTLENDPISPSSVLPLIDDQMNIFRYIFSLIILGFGVTGISLYLFFINNVRRRSAFIRLGINIKAKKQSKSEMKIQLKWIETIMPLLVKNDYFEHLDQIRANKWVYIMEFDNVSILFADIVGFTKMSSNKTAPQVVMLLNDLFNRFDEICKLTNCEKLGTLGDCYYCVAGCPNPRSDHATCCIEMGLSMCCTIQNFNHHHTEDVNMRVGIHTGRVNAAIIGNLRFRFDVYSNDVIIANSMESTGRPGRVHISETTYRLVENFYKVEKGDDLEIKREEDQGIGGMLLKSTFIKTYYVDPKSSHFIQNDKTHYNPTEFKVLTSQQRESSTTDDDDEDTRDLHSKDTTLAREGYHSGVDKDMEFIEGLKYDPDHLTDLFENPPLRFFSMKFFNYEVEWHFNNYCFEYVDSFSLDSMKFAPFIDSLISFLYSILFFIAAIVLFPEIEYKDRNIILCNILFSLLLVFIIFWHSVSAETSLVNKFDKCLFRFLSHTVTKCFICFHFISSPILITILTLERIKDINKDYTFTVKYFTVILFSLFVIPLYLSANYFIKCIFCLINVTLAFLSLLNNTYCKNESSYNFPQYSCLGQENVTEHSYYSKMRYNFGFQIILTLILLLLLIREMERNIRIWFYISREAEICRDEATRMMRNSEEMLYNIIPKYVFYELKNPVSNQKELMNFNYALAVPNAGVLFACISNFFSNYYREDYKGGESALKLLHKIICSFDNIMKKKCYKDVEKIKTINDCYMVASGLNIRETERNNSKHEHLIALMDYGFDLIKTLENFNENFIIGSYKFQIKIGYNFGSLTAGIIGSTKPLYDIWGNTVNVSSRMYSTGISGKIQVPRDVAEELKLFFDFKYRGKIFVKGKGDMDTYICLGSKTKKGKSFLRPDSNIHLTNLTTLTNSLKELTSVEDRKSMQIRNSDRSTRNRKSKRQVTTLLTKRRNKRITEREENFKNTLKRIAVKSKGKEKSLKK